MAYSGKTGVAAQDYFPVRHRRIDDVVRKVRVLKCSEPTCQREVELFDNGSVQLPNPTVAEKFARMGCEIGKNRNRDRCAVCAENERLARRKSPKEEPMKIDANKNIPLTERAVMNGASRLPAEMPEREMDTDERRVIFAAIDERWAGKEQGYITPWTDQGIASHLGVPMSWVSQVRSQFFGDIRDNSEIRELLDRVTKYSVDASQKVAEAQQLAEQARSLYQKSNALNASIAELKRGIDGAIAIATRIEKALK